MRGQLGEHKNITGEASLFYETTTSVDHGFQVGYGNGQADGFKLAFSVMREIISQPTENQRLRRDHEGIFRRYIQIPLGYRATGKMVNLEIV